MFPYLTIVLVPRGAPNVGAEGSYDQPLNQSLRAPPVGEARISARALLEEGN